MKPFMGPFTSVLSSDSVMRATEAHRMSSLGHTERATHSRIKEELLAARAMEDSPVRNCDQLVTFSLDVMRQDRSDHSLASITKRLMDSEVRASSAISQTVESLCKKMVVAHQRAAEDYAIMSSIPRTRLDVVKEEAEKAGATLIITNGDCSFTVDEGLSHVRLISTEVKGGSEEGLSFSGEFRLNFAGARRPYTFKALHRGSFIAYVDLQCGQPFDFIRKETRPLIKAILEYRAEQQGIEL